MIFQKKLLLLVASATLLASSACAESIRAAAPRRELKKEKEKDKDKDKAVQNPVPVAPVAPPAPTTPPTPKAVDLWRSKCKSPVMDDCLARNNANFEACTTCLYAFSLTSATSNSGVINCGRGLCRGCVDEAAKFFQCGVGSSGTGPVVVPSPAPVVTVAPPAPTATVVAQAPTATVVAQAPTVTLPPVPDPSTTQVPDPVATPEVAEFTYDDCPIAKPNSGDICVVPAPFKFRQCDYTTANGSTHRCTCAYSFYMCNPAPIAPTPKPVMPPPPPVPPTPQLSTDPGVCSATVPKSGSSCVTGGLPFIRCCYKVDTLNGQPTAVNDVFKCTCLQGEGAYMCLPGTADQCDVLVRPVDSAPVPAPVPAVALPAIPVVPAPIMMVPTMVVPIPAAPVSTVQPECPPKDSPPNTGDSCAAVIPEGSALTYVQCNYEQTYTDTTGAVTFSEKKCGCQSSTMVFSCEGSIPEVPELEFVPFPDTMP
eukprot:jgi/Psemu1/5416/gm1.5416_g